MQRGSRSARIVHPGHAPGARRAVNDDPATRAFRAFFTSGDPRHVGTVFDRLAPELLLVAARLLPPGGDAADVVQQTFVTALQQRARFDTRRPVAPWLVGILLQHVRRERRRLRRNVDPTRVRPPAADEDPALAAMSREDAEHVHRAVAALPQPYRQVLLLHLVHGLPPQAIAASLGRPFRTVQSQLRRGLERLRPRLPAVALAAWPGSLEQGLPAVREAVLRAASSAALVAWWSLPLARIAALLLLLLPPCALAAAGVAARGAGSPGPVTAANATAPPAADERRPASAPDHGTAARTPVQDPTAQDAAGQDPAPTCRMRVRLVRSEDGAALAGAAVRVAFQRRDANGRSGAWTTVGTFATDADGVAAWSVPRDGRHGLELKVEADGRVSMERRTSTPDIETFALDGVAVWPLARGRIRVRDQHGAPVAGLRLLPHPSFEHGFAPSEPVRAAVDDAGWTGPIALAVGRQRVEVEGIPAGFEVQDGHSVEVELRAGDNEIVLRRLDPRRAIAGRMVDPDGAAVPGGWAWLVRPSDGAPVGTYLTERRRTDAEGRFVLPVPDDAQGPFAIVACLDAGGDQRSEATYAPGTTDAVVQLQWPDGIALRVVDASTGAPIEHYRVACFGVISEQLGRITGDRDYRLEGRHPDGQVFVDGVEGGPHRLCVVPLEDDRWLPTGYLPIEVAQQGVTKLTVRLHRPAPMVVKLAFADGTPVAGSRVRLRAKLSDQDYVPIRDLRQQFGSSHWQGRLDLAVATTDERGIAELPWQVWREPLVVRADGPGHVVAERELPGFEPGGEPIELRVARGATVHGTVRGIERWRELDVDCLGQPCGAPFDHLRPGVVLRSAADGSLVKDAEGKAFPIAAEGTFTCGDVPPGRWQVLFTHAAALDSPSTGRPVRLLLQPLAEFVTIGGQVHDVGIDFAKVLPGVVEGQVFLDGKPVRPDGLGFSTMGVDHLGRSDRANGGLFWERFVRPDGTYRVCQPPGDVRVQATIDGKDYRHYEPIPLAPGERKTVDLHFRQLVAVVRLVRPDGTPVRDRVVRIDGRLLQSDAAGRVVVDPAPALQFDVEVYAADLDRPKLATIPFGDPRARTTTLGPVAIDGAKARSEIDLVVPD